MRHTSEAEVREVTDSERDAEKGGSEAGGPSERGVAPWVCDRPGFLLVLEAPLRADDLFRSRAGADADGAEAFGVNEGVLKSMPDREALEARRADTAPAGPCIDEWLCTLWKATKSISTWLSPIVCKRVGGEKRRGATGRGAM